MESEVDSLATFIESDTQLGVVQKTEQRDASPRTYSFFDGFCLGIFSGLALFFLLLLFRDHSILHSTVYTPTLESTIEFNNTTYGVYGPMIMTGGFSDHYPPDCNRKCWEFLFEADTAKGQVSAEIWGDSAGPLSESFESYIENGNTWHRMDLLHRESHAPEFDCEEGVFLKINADGTVEIATNYGVPTFIEYSYSDTYGETKSLLRQLNFAFWPMLILSGIVWGLKTEKKPFVSGLMYGSAVWISLPIIVYINAILSGGLR